MQTPARIADHPIDPRFLERWSPRAFSPDDISEQELHTLFEAARWAPSSYNSQPWRVVYALRGTPHWETLLGLLNDFNRSWAQNAAALVIFLSKTTFTPPGASAEIVSASHSFDTGSAWGYFALQASHSGWQAHAMAGFDKEKTRSILGVPADISVEAAVAIGKPGDKSSLPAALQEREYPSSRQPVSSFAFEGAYKG